MRLIWDNNINLTEAANNTTPKKVAMLLIGNEPTNDIQQYYIDEALSGSKEAQVVLSDYDNIAWGIAKQSLTSQRVRRLGIKTFPQLGAYGFYLPLYEDTGKLVVPIHNHGDRTVAPTLSATQDSDTITFTITPPENVVYDCYRIVMRSGYFAVEYITYETVFTISKPASETYTTYCIGYKEEEGTVSADSQAITLVVVSEQEAPISMIRSIAFDSTGHIVFTLADGTSITSTNTLAEAVQS